MKANKAPETYPMQLRNKIDEYLWKEHHILGGCCSSVESLKYSIAREEAIEQTVEWLTKHAKKYYINKERYLGTDELVEDYKLIMSMKDE